MKKLLVGVSMVLVLGLVANVALSDETIPFPFWQHGWSIMSFWSVVNAGTANTTVTVNGLLTDGTPHFSTTATIAPNTAWQPATYEGWYTFGDGFGFGSYNITSAENQTYLWGAVFALLSNMQPGYTIVMPGNPYGT